MSDFRYRCATSRKEGRADLGWETEDGSMARMEVVTWNGTHVILRHIVSFVA